MDGLEVFVVLSQFLWSNRNNVLWNQIRKKLVLVVEQAMKWLDEFGLVLRSDPSRLTVPCSVERQVMLDVRCFKMTVDGVVF